MATRQKKIGCRGKGDGERGGGWELEGGWGGGLRVKGVRGGGGREIADATGRTIVELPRLQLHRLC